VAKRGQPPYKPTEADRTTVLVMTAAGIKQEDIAPCIGASGIDPKTLRRHFRRELSIGVAKVNALCSQGIVRAMQNGEAWSLCFWAKARMGWRERSTHEHQMLDEQGQPAKLRITVEHVGQPAVRDREEGGPRRESSES
jgi:hypothetical protein